MSTEFNSTSPLAPQPPTRAGDKRRWSGLHGSALGLAVANTAQRHPGLTLVVTPHAATATRLEEEIRFFRGPEAAQPLHFPDWETLPYDAFSPHQDIVSERLHTLAHLHECRHGVLVTSVNTLMSRLTPPSHVNAYCFELKVGDKLVIQDFRERLQSAGYHAVGQVAEHGEFAVRGSLIDVYPMGRSHPLRIDLLDDEVDSLRTFDADSQRSMDSSDSVTMMPAREFPTHAEAIAGFRRRWRAAFAGDPRKSPVYRDMSDGLLPAGIEYYLPLFFEQCATIFDYLPANTLVVTIDEVLPTAESYWLDVNERFEQLRHNGERPIMAPGDIYLPVEQLFAGFNSYPRVDILSLDTEGKSHCRFDSKTPTRLPIDGRAAQPLAPLQQFMAGFAGRILFVAESKGRRETLLETFAGYKLRPQTVDSWPAFLAGEQKVAITVAGLENGAQFDRPGLSIITEGQLFGERASQSRRRRRTKDPESLVRDLGELNVGAAVVHELHGVGRYRGLTTMELGGRAGEFLTLEYAGGDRLYVPVSSLNLVGRYTGADTEHAPLHRLGSGQWEKAKRKAAERACDVAAELLDIHARRAARQGRRFTLDRDQYRTFVQAFRFEETPDQQQAIDMVLEDMVGDKTMDRLVCGDVGFGKTEVAMRAAFVAVQDGRQVAILVPTTLLAQQHQENFQDRFADWPVRVEQLSRFKSKKQRDQVVANLKSGTIDIVIGTHKLLQSDIQFKRLGLVIIDEEHRFGVRQKERFKALRSEVDVLTLTATPIPRTLNMAMAGLRDLSLIASPPERRLSIRTFIRQWETQLLREAVLREIRRGGQVFFVHNRVEDIESIADRVEEIVPEAKVRVAHGQMRERQLEQVMLDFYHRRFNILVCTTIIETGIDVPTANTIVINRADRFGLAQLHQLRGRVGRSHHRAYAYMLVPDKRAMTVDAVKRLEAIESLEELGIGFSLATHDLEIRGAGELLGENQSGQMHEIGYAMYTRLLERAVVALKSGRNPQLDRPLDHGTEVDLHSPALIPEDYLPDVHNRLIAYKRIASATDQAALRELNVEMIDRFGLLPQATKDLFSITQLKLKAMPLGVRKIDIGERGGRVVFDDKPNIDPTRIIDLIQSKPRQFRLDGPNTLRIQKELPTIAERLQELDNVLTALAKRAVA